MAYSSQAIRPADPIATSAAFPLCLLARPEGHLSCWGLVADLPVHSRQTAATLVRGHVWQGVC